jgi:hypothetical protein
MFGCHAKCAANGVSLLLMATDVHDFDVLTARQFYGPSLPSTYLQWEFQIAPSFSALSRYDTRTIQHDAFRRTVPMSDSRLSNSTHACV